MSEQVESARRYFHVGDPLFSEKVVRYEIDVPAEYSLLEEESNADMFHQFYVNDSGEYIDFTYQYETENTGNEAFIVDQNTGRKSVTVHGTSADLYLSLDENASSTIIWTDPSTGALIDVTAFLGEDALISLAESVTPIEK